MSKSRAGRSLEKILEWIQDLGPFLIPPFLEPEKDSLLSSVRDDLEADAASLFLLAEGDRHELRYASGKGYDDGYSKMIYHVDQTALTPHVLRSRVPINKSHKELKASNGVTPFTGRCKDYIATKRFLNIIAVPLVFEENPLGVLKIENKKGSREGDAFPSDDFIRAKILGRTLTLLLQQRVYTGLLTQGDVLTRQAQSRDWYLQQVVQVLKRWLGAECCSVFIQEDEPKVGSVLRCKAAIGYTAEFNSHEYKLPPPGAQATSFTTHIAAQRAAIRALESELATSGKYPYSGACKDFIQSREFRDILAVALVDDERGFGNSNAPCYGVLKLENKEPKKIGYFGPGDIALCKAFVTRQLVPTLKRLGSSSIAPSSQSFLPKPYIRSSPPLGSGLEVLREALSNDIPKDKVKLLELAARAFQLQHDRPGVITMPNIAEFLRIPLSSLSTVNRWKRAWRKRESF